MAEKINVAVVGATGAVGETMLQILREVDFPINQLYALASSRSAGEPILFKNKPVMVEDLETFDFSQAQIALFSAGGKVSQAYAPKAAKAGCVVIDNTSHFRMHPDVPLVVPEINAHRIKDFTKNNMIANPNCSTIQMCVALKPIYDKVGIKRINVATYQSVSGAGRKAIDELASQTKDLLSGISASPKVFPAQIAFNVIPQIDVFEDNGYTKEEMKMVNETRKIFEDETIEINATAVRVPVFYGHSEAIAIETRDKITAKEAKALLREAKGVKLMEADYPMPLPNGSGYNEVYVGRIREDISHPLGLNLWVVSDNIRKGAALNSVQIAQGLLPLIAE